MARSRWELEETLGVCDLHPFVGVLPGDAAKLITDQLESLTAPRNHALGFGAWLRLCWLGHNVTIAVLVFRWVVLWVLAVLGFSLAFRYAPDRQP